MQSTRYSIWAASYFLASLSFFHPSESSPITSNTPSAVTGTPSTLSSRSLGPLLSIDFPSTSDDHLFRFILQRRIPYSRSNQPSYPLTYPKSDDRQCLHKRQFSPDPLHSTYNLIPRAEFDTALQNNSLASGANSLKSAHDKLFKIAPQVTNWFLALFVIPAFVVIFGLFSAFVKEKLYIGEATLAVGFGIILGPYVSGVFDPRSWDGGRSFDHLTLELTRIVIVLSAFAVGVELPKAYVLRHWQSLVILIGPVILFGWIVSGALIYALVPALTFLESLLVAAAITPTDPVLAASVVGKGRYAQKHVPVHLRHLLQAEAGCNDGAAFPFFYLALFLLLRHQTSLATTIAKWFALVVLYEILLGIAIGAFIGILARKTLKFCKRRSLIDKESMVAMYVALALSTTGLTALAGSDDLLAAFSCGVAFAWDDWFTESIEASNFSSVVDLLANCAIFIYVGASIPFSSWNDATLTLVPWRLVVLGFSILAVRRLPFLVLMKRIIPDFKTHREAVFCGHFGPMGIGSIFLATLATSKLPTPRFPPETSLDTLALATQPLIYLIVFFSILVHGLSIPFFTLGKNVHSRVNTMTRTWTQPYGNEPSWVNHVRSVSQPNETLADVTTFEANTRPGPTSDLPQPISSELAQRQSSDDTQVENLTNVEKKLEPDKQQPQIHSSLPPLSRNSTTPVAQEHTLRKLTSRVGLLGLGSTTKRTPEEQAAYQREKLIRDAWCRPERIDVLKKDEERVYKSGRQLIIERGDGEVEVRDLPYEEKTFGDPSAFHSHLGESSNQPEQSGAMRKFDLVKLIIPRHLSKSKLLSSTGPATGMPVPGEGPHSRALDEQLSDQAVVSLTGNALPASTRVCSQDDQPAEIVWVESGTLVIQSKDGEDVRLGLRMSNNLEELNIRPASSTIVVLPEQSHFNPSSASFFSSSPASESLRANSDRPLSDSEESTKMPSGLMEDGNDEWEEESDDLELEDQGGSSSFHSVHPNRHRSATIHKLHPSRHSILSRRRKNGRASGGISISRTRESTHPGRAVESITRPAPFSRTVESNKVEKTKASALVDPSRGFSRTSSPSRFIRFVEQPERHMRASQMNRVHRSTSRTLKRRPGKSKMKLENFVSPAVDSSRQSNLTGIITPSLHQSSRSSFIGVNNEGPSEPADLAPQSRHDSLGEHQALENNPQNI